MFCTSNQTKTVLCARFCVSQNFDYKKFSIFHTESLQFCFIIALVNFYSVSILVTLSSDSRCIHMHIHTLKPYTYKLLIEGAPVQKRRQQ